MTRWLAVFSIALVAAQGAAAGPENFHTGGLIKDYGKFADVPAAKPLPADTRFKVAMDVVDGGETGEVNSLFAIAAGFINLQHSNGIPPEQVDIALVVHGSAHRDLLNDEAYGGDNPNAELLEILQGYGVKVLYCGQNAVMRDVAVGDLLPGVEMTHSATTTHVLLQQQGYSLRP
ncbi:MAG: intracellular sulfur oxidation DsrE/DsrF family protein [Glaciecola sp.]|jgi:intracellular sulfur oxidation DsrE/DsrF family protein|uniref:DsrE family protein n=1 Tax=Congregibacter sp. TaxID=2744308 RepID=UPI0039E2EED6